MLVACLVLSVLCFVTPTRTIVQPKKEVSIVSMFVFFFFFFFLFHHSFVCSFVLLFFPLFSFLDQTEMTKLAETVNSLGTGVDFRKRVGEIMWAGKGKEGRRGAFSFAFALLFVCGGITLLCPCCILLLQAIANHCRLLPPLLIFSAIVCCCCCLTVYMHAVFFF